MKLHDYRQKLKARHPLVVQKVKKDLAFQIGKEVEMNRLSKGLTQVQLARKLRTKQPSIARLENGSGLPSLRFLKKVADAFGMTIEFRFQDIRPTFSTQSIATRNLSYTSPKISTAAREAVMLDAYTATDRDTLGDYRLDHQMMKV